MKTFKGCVLGDVVRLYDDLDGIKSGAFDYDEGLHVKKLKKMRCLYGSRWVISGLLPDNETAILSLDLDQQIEFPVVTVWDCYCEYIGGAEEEAENKHNAPNVSGIHS